MRGLLLLGLICTSGCAATHSATEDAGSDRDAAEGDAGVAGPDAGSGPCEPPDSDCDGHDALEAGGDDCDDEAASRHPGAPDGAWIFETVGDVSPGFAAGVAVDWAAVGEPTFAWSSWTSDWAPESNPMRVSSLVDGVRRTALPVLSTSETHPICCDVSSVVVDRAGATLLGFHRRLESGAYQMSVLRWVDGAWNEEAIDDDPFQSYGRLVLDLDGEPNAVYGADDLRHARRQPDGLWWTERIDDHGWSPQVAVDADGHLHVSYGTIRPGPSEIRYATNASGEWVITTVWAEGPIDLQTSVVVDANRVPTVFYNESEGRGLVAATRTDDGWSESVVDGSWSWSLDSAADPAGGLHVAYQVALEREVMTSGELRYARRQPDGWTTELISVGYLGEFETPRISAGAGGIVRIAFQNGIDDTVQLVRGSPAGDGIDQDCDGRAE